MKSILIFVEDNYEDLELWYPRLRLEETGYKSVVAGPQGNHLYKAKHGYPCISDIAIDDVKGGDFQGILIPGGFAPDKLRRLPKVLELLREFNEKHKMIAFICHAGWVPISAKILKGRKATSVKAIKDDMENAGAIWSDQIVVVDKNLISSRMPSDLPSFAKAMCEFLEAT